MPFWTILGPVSSGRTLRPSHVWLWFFCYSVFSALLFQFVLLPHVFTAWHYGHGLVVPPGDWVSFHEYASLKALLFNLKGWTAIRDFLPTDSLPIKISSIIYWLVAPEPWALIPLQSALHAGSGLVLFLIVRSFIGSPILSLMSALPFVAYPSSLTWYAQIHRDGYVFLGILTLLWGWMLMVRQIDRLSPQSLLNALAIWSIGLLLLLVGRPYLVEPLFWIGLLFWPVFVAASIARYRTSSTPWKNWIPSVAFYSLTLAVMYPCKKFGISGTAPEMSTLPATVQSSDSKLDSQARVKRGTLKSDDILTFSIAPDAVIEEPRLSAIWQKTAGLPKLFEDKAYVLASVRDGFRHTHPGAPTAIDFNRRPTSAWQVAALMPRAFQVGLLAPFPSHWSGGGSVGVGQLMRQITGFEMFLVYIGIVFFGGGFILFRNRLDLWLLAAVCGGLILLFGLVVTNVGTLYRLRYGFLMCLAAVGNGVLLQSLVGAYSGRVQRTIGSGRFGRLTALLSRATQPTP